MKHYLIEKGYIPLDKSWIIRMGILDLLNNYDDIFRFIKGREELGDDLQALYRALTNWRNNKPIDVGESGTLYRFLQFASWKRGEDKKFTKRGTLKKRKICDDPEIVNYSLEKLLELDNGTSQWASASVLLGNEEVIDNPPFKLKLTYEAVKHWNEKRNNEECWEERCDEAILRQAEAYLDLFHTGKTNFVPIHSEDAGFALIVSPEADLISLEQAKKKFPSLAGHETNRFDTIEEAIKNLSNGETIDIPDHRIVYPAAMYLKIKNKDMGIEEIKSRFKDPSVVNKSWPQFWKFLEDSQYL